MGDVSIPGAPVSWTRDQHLALAWTAPKHRPILRSFCLADALFGHIALATPDTTLARIKLAWWGEQGIESGMLDRHLSSEVNRPLLSIPESQTWLRSNLLVWDQLVGQWPPDDRQIVHYAASRGALLAQAVDTVIGGSAAVMAPPLARWAAQNLGRHTNTASVRAMVDQYLLEKDHFKRIAAIPAPVRVLARLANRSRSARSPDILTAARGAVFDFIL